MCLALWNNVVLNTLVPVFWYSDICLSFGEMYRKGVNFVGRAYVFVERCRIVSPFAWSPYLWIEPTADWKYLGRNLNLQSTAVNEQTWSNDISCSVCISQILGLSKTLYLPLLTSQPPAAHWAGFNSLLTLWTIQHNHHLHYIGYYRSRKWSKYMGAASCLPTAFRILEAPWDGV